MAKLTWINTPTTLAACGKYQLRSCSDMYVICEYVANMKKMDTSEHKLEEYVSNDQSSKRHIDYLSSIVESGVSCATQRRDMRLVQPSADMLNALIWAIPVLRASLNTLHDRNIVADKLVNMWKSHNSEYTRETLNLAATMLRSSADIVAIPESDNKHLEAIRKLRALHDVTPLRHLSMSGIKNALDWVLSWAAVLPAASRLRNACGEPDPHAEDQCPCCKRKILDILGEAPTAIKVWVCSSCYDAGIARKGNETYYQCRYNECFDERGPFCQKHEGEIAAESIIGRVAATKSPDGDELHGERIAKIREEISSWHEQLGVEATRKNATPEYVSKSASDAMLMHKVLSLFDVTM